MILFDENFEEIGPIYSSGDFEIGDSNATNDFQFDAELPQTGGVYIPGTEVGGVFEYRSSLFDKTPTVKGWTWRGLLTQDIITPPSGSDYCIVSGEANSILSSMLANVLGGFFCVPAVDSGLSVSKYQFKLYCTYLDGLTDMLTEYGYRLKIYARKSDENRKVRVYCEAVPAEVVEGEYNDDSQLTLQFIDNQMGFNHLVCMGKGELQERERIDLYVQADGKIGTEKYYTGFKERTAFFDYSSAESTEDLRTSGIKKLKELASGKKLKILSESVELEIGDIVRGRHRESGFIVEAPINKKIYRITGDIVDIEYGIKEEE